MKNIVILSIVAALATAGLTMVLYEVKPADASSNEFCVQATGAEQNCFTNKGACHKFIKENNIAGTCVKQG